MFFTKEDRDALKENTKDIKSLDGVVCKNIVQVNDLIPRINMLEAHVKSLLSKNDDLKQEVYQLNESITALDYEDGHIHKKIDALDKKFKQDRSFIIDALKDIHRSHNDKAPHGLKADGTPAKKRGRKPNQKYFNLEEVCEITTLGKSTIYRWRHEGKFPKPVKLGTKTVWRRDDVNKWMEEVTHADNMVTK
jgi:prophage regulatory protein